MFLDIPNMRELLSAGVTFVWLPWEVTIDMTDQLVTLNLFAALVPATGQDRVIFTPPSDVLLADVVLH
jgi:hypothetical protein